MSAAVNNGVFRFTSGQTIDDLLLVAEALRKSGQTPTLRFVQSYNESIESVAVDVAVIDLTKAVVASLKESARRQRGPSNYDVVSGDESHGIFDTLEEALGCVAFDNLKVWEVWHDHHIVAENPTARPGEMAVAGYDEAPDPAEGRLA